MHRRDPRGGFGPRTLVLAVRFAAGLALAAGAAAPAADAKPQAAPPDTATPVMFLKETVVTGARHPRAYFESPQALSFVSGTQLRESAPVVLGDIFSTLPGVESNKDSPWEQRPSVRGLTGQRVLVLMDGTPMNSVRGNGPHPSLVDPSQVERIEVVRGPSAVAYGSDAIGGAINIITRGPRPAAPGRALRGTATVGASFDGLPARNGALDLSVRAGRLSGLFAGGGRKSDDFRNADGTVPHSGFSDWNALASLRADLSERLVARGGVQLYRAKDVGLPGLDVTVPGYSQTFRFKHYERGHAHLTLDETYAPASWLEGSRVKAYWQREHRDFYSDIDIAVPMGPGVRGNLALEKDRGLDLETYGVQAQMTSRRTSRHRFSAGVDAARDLTGGVNSEVQAFTSPYGASPPVTVVSASVPNGRFDNFAGFVQGELYLGPRWTIDAGGRYTHYRYRTDRTFMAKGPEAGDPVFYFEPMSRDDDALSGSLGVVHTPVADLHLTANVANGYREPNAQDLYFSGPGSVGFVIGNPGLRPERSVSYDIGLRWGPRTLAFSGNLFYSTFKDLINALPAPPPPEAQGEPVYRYTNVTAATMWGGEAEAEWQFHPRWAARAAMSGTVGDITSREAILELYGLDADRVPLEMVPPFRGQASVRWSERGRRLWAELGARYSWRTNRLPPVTPGAEQLAEFKREWLVGDVAAGARLETGQRLVVGVRNLADLRYRQALGSVVEPGRTVYVSLSSDF